MSNVRSLKKDIDFLVTEIISDCQLYIYLHPKDSKVDTAMQIIEKAADMRNQLYERVNHPDGKNDGKLVKKHYAAIRKDLVESSHKLFEEISTLSN